MDETGINHCCAIAIRFLPAIRSLERRARYLFYCMFFVCFLFGQRFLDNPRAMPKFACGRTLVPDMSSPFWRLAAPGGRKKGEMKFSLLYESIGNFCILAVFERYLSNAWTHPNQILFVGTMSADVSPPPLGSISPWEGRRGKGVKNFKKWGVVSFVHRKLPFLFFSAFPNVV